jgi:competence ComEA-like helix-hairpin-helix protein
MRIWLLLLTILAAEVGFAEPVKTPVLAHVERIDLNLADEAALTTLPGIGPKKAQAIIAMRTRKPFTRLTQLLQVKGIGKKTLEKLRPLVKDPGYS